MTTEGAFEARKWGWRQTKEGIVVSFLVHPNDINAALAIAPLGTIYALGFREMPDGDQSVAPSTDAGCGSTAPAGTVNTPADAPPEPAVAGGAPKLKRCFSELPRSAQAAMLCETPAFQPWVIDSHEPWAAMPADKHTATGFVREACDVVSRREFDTNVARGQRWDIIYIQYMRETGQLAEERT